MSDLAIRVDGLSKQYRIGSQERYRTLRDTVASTLRRARHPNGHHDTIWALKDVSFDVRHGEVLGIIGRNGAGKSTLLKILSRITEPTEGFVEVFGRVGALLEVGTGFHPELTGRENIYLNGAILGMAKAEITRKFDEIVSFAEVEKFIDTPVKHYSSGMGLRLGFAVAAHLEPAILIVDEVLAVGDAVFQAKCIGKMSQVASDGRTVLFVSHNLAAIANLTARTVVIDKGHLHFDGETLQAITQYVALSATQNTTIPLTGNRALVTPCDLFFLNARREKTSAFQIGQDMTIRFIVSTATRLPLEVVFAFVSSDGTRAFTVSNHHETGQPFWIDGETAIDCHIDDLRLVEGSYTVRLSLYAQGQWLYQDEQAAMIDMIGGKVFESNIVPARKHGVYVQRSQWQVLPSPVGELPG